MEIEIRNWEKYNPKRAQKTYTWMRIDIDIAKCEEFYGLSNLEKYTAILLIGEATRKGKGRFWLSVDWFCAEVLKEPVQFLLDLLAKLAQPGPNGKSFLEIHFDPKSPDASSLPATTPDYPRDYTALPPVLQSTTPTNERDETNGRHETNVTDVSFDLNNIGPSEFSENVLHIPGVERSSNLTDEAISTELKLIRMCLGGAFNPDAFRANQGEVS